MMVPDPLDVDSAAKVVKAKEGLDSNTSVELYLVDAFGRRRKEAAGRSESLPLTSEEYPIEVRISRHGRMKSSRARDKKRRLVG
jgi:hypothetical protein